MAKRASGKPKRISSSPAKVSVTSLKEPKGEKPLKLNTVRLNSNKSDSVRRTSGTTHLPEKLTDDTIGRVLSECKAKYKILELKKRLEEKKGLGKEEKITVSNQDTGKKLHKENVKKLTSSPPYAMYRAKPSPRGMSSKVCDDGRGGYGGYGRPKVTQDMLDCLTKREEQEILNLCDEKLRANPVRTPGRTTPNVYHNYPAMPCYNDKKERVSMLEQRLHTIENKLCNTKQNPGPSPSCPCIDTTCPAKNPQSSIMMRAIGDAANVKCKVALVEQQMSDLNCQMNKAVVNRCFFQEKISKLEDEIISTKKAYLNILQSELSNLRRDIEAHEWCGPSEKGGKPADAKSTTGKSKKKKKKKKRGKSAKRGASKKSKKRGPSRKRTRK